MDLTLTDILLEATRPLKETRIPKVVGQPFVKVWSVSESFESDDKTTAMLYALLPAYWQSEGIVDCKILRSDTQGAFVIIESWTNQKTQSDFEKGSAWRDFIRKTSEPGAPCPARIKVLAKDIYELIE